MRFLALILYLCLYFPLAAQQVNLTSIQHGVRWLDEVRFPPHVKNPGVSSNIMTHTVSALSKKFNVDAGTIPPEIDYKLIMMFGKTRLTPPARSSNAKDYQASVLSLITRATSGTDIFWEMKTEVRQNENVIYSRETRHQLLNYEPGHSWLDESSFRKHFNILIDELFELSPPLSQKIVLGKGIDHAELLKTDSQTWEVLNATNILGFGLPSFGPYTTLDAGKLDTPVIRTKKIFNTESSIGVSDGKGFSFDQFRNIDFSKRKICYLQLNTGSDTLQAIYSIIVRSTGARRTFLSTLLSNDDEDVQLPPSSSYRNIAGMIKTDSSTWDFNISSYNKDGSIGSATLTNEHENFQLFFKQHQGMHWEIITTNQNGEYLASLDSRSSGKKLTVRNNLDRHALNAIAGLYAVLMSTRNAE
jgi:hypothetical protein